MRCGLRPKSGDCACARDSHLARTLGAISSSRCQISRGGEEPDRPFDGRETDKLPGRTQTRWWSQTGSNRRPPACKAGALPTELWPPQGSESLRDQKSSNRYDSRTVATARPPRLVGLGRFELPTSRLSSARSNQLSYKPPAGRAPSRSSAIGRARHELVHEERETKTAVSR